MPKITLQSAQNNEHQTLTDIALASKMYWKYPKEYLLLWKTDLTITAEYIEKNKVLTARKGKKTVGFCSITAGTEKLHPVEGSPVTLSGYWIDALFIHPRYIRQGIGKQLMLEMFSYCMVQDIETLYVFSEPHATGFYEKFDAHKITEIPATVGVNRILPVYGIKVG